MSTTAESRQASPEGAELVSGAYVTSRRAAAHSVDAETRALEAIRARNREFQQKTDGHLALPITLLTEQRDQALRQLELQTARTAHRWWREVVRPEGWWWWQGNSQEAFISQGEEAEEGPQNVVKRMLKNWKK